MSTGWDPGGSDRLLCTAPEVLNNLFIGESPWRGAVPAPTPPTVALGLTDFSIEFWVKWKFGNSPGDDLFFYSFFLDDSGGFARPGASVQWLTGGPTLTLSIAGVGTATDVGGGTVGEWSHYEIAVDRSADMIIYKDNVAEDTTNIAGNSGVDLGTLDFYPLIYEETLKIATNQNFEDGPNNWFDNAISPVIMGPVAVHNRIMTSAERDASRVGRLVQDFGSAVTQLRYNWEVDGETGWDTNLAHILNGYRVGASTPMSAPEGVTGTVRVLDQSGNGRHFTFPVSASYSTDGANVTEVAASKACIAFGADNFFA